jgi:hypothetical protein
LGWTENLGSDCEARIEGELCLEAAVQLVLGRLLWASALRIKV